MCNRSITGGQMRMHCGNATVKYRFLILWMLWLVFSTALSWADCNQNRPERRSPAWLAERPDNPLYNIPPDDCHTAVLEHDEGDLQVLQDIIDLNYLQLEPLDLGEQTWVDDRLTALVLPTEVHWLPQSIGGLSALTHLTVIGTTEGGLWNLTGAIGDLTNLIYLDLY